MTNAQHDAPQDPPQAGPQVLPEVVAAEPAVAVVDGDGLDEGVPDRRRGREDDLAPRARRGEEPPHDQNQGGRTNRAGDSRATRNSIGSLRASRCPWDRVCHRLRQQHSQPSAVVFCDHDEPARRVVLVVHHRAQRWGVHMDARRRLRTGVGDSVNTCRPERRCLTGAIPTNDRVHCRRLSLRSLPRRARPTPR